MVHWHWNTRWGSLFHGLLVFKTQGMIPNPLSISHSIPSWLTSGNRCISNGIRNKFGNEWKPDNLDLEVDGFQKIASRTSKRFRGKMYCKKFCFFNATWWGKLVSFCLTLYPCQSKIQIENREELELKRVSVTTTASVRRRGPRRRCCFGPRGLRRPLANQRSLS